MMKEASFIEDCLEEKLEEGLQQGLQQGFQKGLEQGREQGLEQGLAQGIRQERRHSRWLILMRILRRRFRELPLSLEERLGRLPTDALDTLVDVAITVSDLETFKAQLDEVSSNVKRVTA
jgi:flagellar biosynthesis/type III secretory pathway protein FliH